MTKKRVNLTFSDTARENAGLIAGEFGISLSNAIEIALENEVTRSGLRRHVKEEVSGRGKQVFVMRWE